MRGKLLTKQLFIILSLAIVLFYTQPANAQGRIDSTSLLSSAKNTTPPDSLHQLSPNAIKSKVVYSTRDSIRFDLNDQKSFLFKDANVDYEDINLKADYIDMNFKNNIVFAQGTIDSSGNEVGKPLFKQSAESFKAKKMSYNFKSKKGLINNIITQEGDGYLHGKIVKKMADNVTFIKNGAYTTCEHENPHYEIRFTKAKVIPNDKIVTGPAYLVIEKIPTPLCIPFGFFPNKKGRSSGVLIPSYGESANRGFFFENGGYYWGINDYVDLALRGDIYTRGSWAVKSLSNYNKLYRYNGNFSLNYAINILGEKNAADYSESKDFSLRWLHNQDPKARPNSRFTANVNIVSAQYNKFNPTSANDYLSNTFQSNVSYIATWAKKYHFSMNMMHSQNTITKTVDLTLPEVTFNVNRFYPLRKKSTVGQSKWFEKISINYDMNTRNRLSTVDSMFSKINFQDFQNGMKHTVAIASPIKVLKYFTMTNSFAYNERWYLQTIDRNWTNDTLITPTDTIVGYVKTDTIRGFAAARDFSFSSSLSTKLYGFLQFKRGIIRAVRHVITPSVGFTYTPDFGTSNWGYYKYYYTDNTETTQAKYSIFEGGIYGSPPSTKSGAINFALSNNLEMKVRSNKDTISGTKKIVLIENFTISSSYDLAKDSLKWSKVVMSGRTKLLKNLDIRYNSLWDPYAVDSNGNNIKRYEWNVNKKALRLMNTEWNFGLNWNLSATTFSSKKKASNEKEKASTNPYAIPWNININYTMRYTAKHDPFSTSKQETVIQTLGFNGEISLTKKWRIGFSSGYDFQNNQFSYTSIDVYRDLHCWEMKFNWIPIGFRKSWNFSINVKSSMLQDLKLNKKKDFRDSY